MTVTEQGSENDTVFLVIVPSKKFSRRELRNRYKTGRLVYRLNNSNNWYEIKDSKAGGYYDEPYMDPIPPSAWIAQ